jgi:hypothetical protein
MDARMKLVALQVRHCAISRDRANSKRMGSDHRQVVDLSQFLLRRSAVESRIVAVSPSDRRQRGVRNLGTMVIAT